jgi:hypothetical protein
MEHTVTLTIPSDWLKEDAPDQDELRQALMLGLAQLRQQKGSLDVSRQTVQILLGTGRIRHLSASLVADKGQGNERQPPPILPDPPVSEVLIAQRRGEW